MGDWREMPHCSHTSVIYLSPAANTEYNRQTNNLSREPLKWLSRRLLPDWWCTLRLEQPYVEQPRSLLTV